jgi:hypothetical protein
MHRALDSYLASFLHRGFSGCRAEKWACVVLWSTKNTQSSAIYKLTSGICNFTKRSAHSILSQFLDDGFSGCRAKNWAFVLPCPTKSTDSFRDIQTDNRTCGLLEF